MDDNGGLGVKIVLNPRPMSSDLFELDGGVGSTTVEFSYLFNLDKGVHWRLDSLICLMTKR